MRAVHYLFILYAMMNVIAFALYGIDKYRARKNRWRIRESVLLGVTWLLGGAGAWLGMKAFRHKTQHMIFRICVPLATFVQVALMGFATAKLL